MKRAWFLAAIPFLGIWVGLVVFWSRIQSDRYLVSDQVTQALTRYRQLAAGYDLGFTAVFPNCPWRHWNDNRARSSESFTVWPHVESANARFRFLSFPTSPKEPLGGALAIQGPLSHSIQLDRQYYTLIASQGIAASGVITSNTYGSLLCLGPMAGRIHSTSYGSVLIDGELSGELAADSYLCAIVTGPCTGKITTKNYAMIYLLGGWQGTIDLGPSRIYIAGRTTQADLSRVVLDSKLGKRAAVFLQHSDLPDGQHVVGDLHVTVGQTPEIPKTSPAVLPPP